MYRDGSAWTQYLTSNVLIQSVVHAALPATKKTRCRRYYPAPTPLVDLRIYPVHRGHLCMMDNNLTARSHWRTHGYQGSGIWSTYGVYLTPSQDRQITWINWGVFQVELDHIYAPISYCQPDENCMPTVPPIGTALAPLELLLVSLSVHAVHRVGDSRSKQRSDTLAHYRLSRAHGKIG